MKPRILQCIRTDSFRARCSINWIYVFAQLFSFSSKQTRNKKILYYDQKLSRSQHKSIVAVNEARTRSLQSCIEIYFNYECRERERVGEKFFIRGVLITCIINCEHFVYQWKAVVFVDFYILITINVNFYEKIFLYNSRYENIVTWKRQSSSY